MEIHKDRLPGSRRLRILESQEKAQKAEQEARESLANYQQVMKNYMPSGPMIPGDVVSPWCGGSLEAYLHAVHQRELNMLMSRALDAIADISGIAIANRLGEACGPTIG